MTFSARSRTHSSSRPRSHCTSSHVFYSFVSVLVTMEKASVLIYHLFCRRAMSCGVEVFVFFSTPTKQNIFAYTGKRFSNFFFLPFHTNPFSFVNAYLNTFLTIVHTKTSENADENESLWPFFQHRFQKLPFPPMHTRRERFENNTFSKGFRFETGFWSLRSH